MGSTGRLTLKGEGNHIKGLDTLRAPEVHSLWDRDLNHTESWVTSWAPEARSVWGRGKGKGGGKVWGLRTLGMEFRSIPEMEWGSTVGKSEQSG